MKKKLYFITTILAALAALSLSSCLKDPRYYTFSQGGTVFNFPKGGLANFAADAVTDPGDTITKQFAVEIASPTVPTSATTVTLAIDNSIVTAYNATESAVNYQAMPAGSFVFTATSVTIPAGQRTTILSVTFYKQLLDPSQSYMLPIKIVSGSSGGVVSGNFGVHYYHFIGNDFAGSYLQNFIRTPAGGNFAGQPVTLSPVTPTQFEAPSGYAGLDVRYEVTFTKTGTGAGATYNNWAVSLNSDDVANLFGPSGITLTVPPVFVTLDPNHAYTYTEATHGLFDFLYNVTNASGAPRQNEDQYNKP